MAKTPKSNKAAKAGIIAGSAVVGTGGIALGANALLNDSEDPQDESMDEVLLIEEDVPVHYEDEDEVEPKEEDKIEEVSTEQTVQHTAHFQVQPTATVEDPILTQDEIIELPVVVDDDVEVNEVVVEPQVSEHYLAVEVSVEQEQTEEDPDDVYNFIMHQPEDETFTCTNDDNSFGEDYFYSSPDLLG